jgi:hypothetical protein
MLSNFQIDENQTSSIKQTISQYIFDPKDLEENHSIETQSSTLQKLLNLSMKTNSPFKNQIQRPLIEIQNINHIPKYSLLSSELNPNQIDSKTSLEPGF